MKDNRNIRKKIRRKKRAQQGLLQLTGREYSELIAEGFITIAILILLYIGSVAVMIRIFEFPAETYVISKSAHEFWVITSDNVRFYHSLFTIVYTIFGAGFTYWRLIRRYRQMQLTHVLDELHKIASGNYDLRIPFQLTGDMGKVADSINRLVDSTVKAMEEERQIEKSKDELITNVSHDIRTPLTSIIGYLGLVISSDETKGKAYAQIAYNKAQQMKRLVDDLFEYTTMRPNGVPLRLNDIPIGAFLSQVTADFELEAQKKHITIELIEETQNVVLEIDAEKMVRVLNNLLSNAIKYGEEESTIHVNVKEIDGVVTIAVSNRGPTLSQEELERLFQRFYRVEGSRSKETGGTGLGLAIADNIVRMHGGMIGVESKDQQTTFYIYLPSDGQVSLYKSKP